MPICSAAATMVPLMLIQILIFLHVLALHSSIAAMEILAWVLVAGAIFLCIKRRQLPENQAWLWAYGAFALAGALSLLVNPLLKPFWFQFGFMRFGLVAFSLATTLRQVWSKSFEQRLLKIWLVTLGLAGAMGVVQCFTGLDFVRHVTEQGGVWRAQGFFSLSLRQMPDSANLLAMFVDPTITLTPTAAASHRYYNGYGYDFCSQLHIS